VALFNDDIETRLIGFRHAEVASVVWYAERILNPARYPAEVLVPRRIGFDEVSRTVIVDLTAPPRTVIPEVSGYRYDSGADTVVSVARSAVDVVCRHRELVSQLVLRVGHELLAARPTNVIAAVDIRFWPPDMPVERLAAASPLISIRFARESFGMLMGLNTPREPGTGQWFADDTGPGLSVPQPSRGSTRARSVRIAGRSRSPTGEETS
jgi:hypothetical protein